MAKDIPIEVFLVGAGLGGLILLKTIFSSTKYDNNPPGPITCPTGQHLVNNTCVPDTITCPTGQHLENGVCVSDTITCPTGQHLEGGFCVPDYVPPPPPPAETDLSMIAPGPVLPQPASTATTLAGWIALGQQASSGQGVQLRDGVYDGVAGMSLSGISPGVIMMAEKAGITQIRGAPLSLASPGIILTGFDLEFSQTSGDYMNITGNNARFTRNKVHFGSDASQKWLIVKANDVLMDHNDISGKTSMDNMITVYNTGFSLKMNYIHDMIGSGTPMEAMRIGDSSTAWTNYLAEIAWNRWENISADTEMVTYKGSAMNVHHNTVINCNSSPTFRHGNYKNYTDNFHFNSGGIRFYGHGHVIKRNQFIEDSRNQLRGPLVFGAGDHVDDASPGTSNAWYAQVRDCEVSQNLIISNAAFSYGHIYLGYGSGTLQPKNNTITNNIVVASKGILTQLGVGALWTDNILGGNILFPTGTATIGTMPANGFTNKDPLLTRMPDNSYIFTASSPLVWPQTVRVLATSEVGINAP